MSKLGIILLIVLAVLLVAFIVLVIVGNRLKKKQDEQQAQIDAAKQTMTMLIIDKKKMKLKDAPLPKIVLEQTPKMMRNSKVPIVKVKVGPKVTSMMADPKVLKSFQLRLLFRLKFLVSISQELSQLEVALRLRKSLRRRA